MNAFALKSQVGVRVSEQERGRKELGEAANSPELAGPGSSQSLYL